MIPIDQCEDRRLYRIHSRNLSCGVYRAETKGFIGIRTKFGDRYLFEEFHYDTGPPYGTVVPEETTEHVLPEGIVLNECLDDVCSKCGIKVKFVIEDEAKHTGHWEHLEDTDCEKVWACAAFNKALFDWIESLA